MDFNSSVDTQCTPCPENGATIFLPLTDHSPEDISPED